MIASPSSLILKDFAIINTNCEVIPFENSNSDFNTLQNSYPIDIDFGLQEDKNKNLSVVFIKITINPEKEKGYYVFVEGMGVFTFDENSNISDEEKHKFAPSAINICITSLRAYIANLTTYYPFGKFNFPTINMTDLLKQKANLP